MSVLSARRYQAELGFWWLRACFFLFVCGLFLFMWVDLVLFSCRVREFLYYIFFYNVHGE